jgi:hypothetical protein
LNKTFRNVFEVYVFALSFFFAARPLSDGDFWWHLKTGEYILNTRSIPRTDFFSFTNYGKAWVAHEWLSEAIFYVIYSSLGFNVLIVVFALLTALAFWIAFKRSSSNPLIGGTVALIGVWAILPNVGVRPRIFTLLLSSVYLALLGRYVRRGQGREIWWLVPLMVLWVNLHGGFLMGLVLIGLTIVGIPLDAWANREKLSSSLPQLKTLFMVLVACMLAACLNPHGIWIYKFPFEIFLSPIQQQTVNDWLSPNFHQSEAVPLFMLILGTIAAFALSPKRPKLSEVILFLATLYMTLKSQRHVAILALVAVPLMADYLQNWITARSDGKLFGPVAPNGGNRRATIVTVLFLLPLVVFAWKLKTTVFEAPAQVAIDAPVKAVEYMQQNRIVGKTLTDPNIWGGYLIWKMPSNPVYIDGRIDMYGDEFVKEYLYITLGYIDWREPLDRYGVQIAIVAPKSVLATGMRNAPNWQQVYQDELAVVFTRR